MTYDFDNEYASLTRELISAGFRENGVINGCIKRYVGDQLSFKMLTQDRPFETFKDQYYIYYLGYSICTTRSKIICQQEDDHYIAWLA